MVAYLNEVYGTPSSPPASNTPASNPPKSDINFNVTYDNFLSVGVRQEFATGGECSLVESNHNLLKCPKNSTVDINNDDSSNPCALDKILNVNKDNVILGCGDVYAPVPWKKNNNDGDWTCEFQD